LPDFAGGAASFGLTSAPKLEAAVPNWGIGDRIYLGARTLQVVGRRDDDEGQPPVLVVEDVA
jgi:hypothetical protein